MNVVIEELDNNVNWNNDILPKIYSGDFKKLDSITLNYIMHNTRFLKFCITFNLKNNNDKSYSFYNFMS